MSMSKSKGVYQEFYRRTAHLVDSIRLDRDKEINLTIDVISEHYPEHGGLLLDVGCGTGRYASPLAQRGYQAVGIDISEEQLWFAMHRLPVQCVSATSLPFRKESFSCVLMSLILHQLAAPEQQQAIQEAWRVLSSSGILVVKTCSHDDLRRRPFGEFFPSSLKINLARYPPITDIKHLMVRTDFRVESIIPTHTTEVLGSEEIGQATRAKHNTTLALLPPDEFESGCTRLEQSLAGRSEFTMMHHHTTLVGRKRA